MKLSGKYKITCLAVYFGFFFNSFSQKPKESTVIPEKEITICHLSNDKQSNSLVIPYSALSTHLEHGDFIGECSSENSPLKLFINKTDVKCNEGSDGTADLDIQFSHGHPHFNIQWSTGATTENISNLRAGVYSVTVSIGNGLWATASATINEPAPLLIDFRTKNVRCAGGSDGEISILPQGGTLPYSFIWSSNAGVQSGGNAFNLSKGIYRASVIDAQGCLSIADIPVEEPAPLTSNSSIGNVLCSNGSDGYATIIPEGGVLPYNFAWSANAGNQSSGIATNLSKGIYNYTVTDGSGCQTSSEVKIDEPLPIKVSFSVISESCSPGKDGNANALVSGGISPYSFQWDLKANSQNQAMATGLAQGTYYILVSDKNGCLASESAIIYKDKCECMLRSEDCGATMVSLAQFVFCNPVAGATNYQWEFSHSQSGFLKTIQRGFALTNFHLTWVPGIQYGKTYNVRIKPFVNGAWKDYGPICEIIVPAPIPYTKVRPSDCGLITTSVNQQLFCDFVAGAQNYQWEFSNAEMGFQKIINRGSNSLSFTLGWVQGIQYGKTYEVRVRANVGGEWGNFGDVCQISLVYPIPTTKVRFADCGITLNSLTQNIFCDAVAGATDYQWEISNAELNFIYLYNRNSSNTSFQFGWVPGIQNQTIYDVRIRAKVAGEWAEYGFVCHISTPNPPIAPRLGNFDDGEAENAIKISEVEPILSVFPNPSKGEAISISLSGFENSENEISMDVYDILGNKVISRNSIHSENNKLAEINNDGELATGIYILNVTAKNKNYYERIIIK